MGGGGCLRDLVVITGGEPLRQNIAPLCEALLAHGLRVQIETNGTLWRELPAAVNVVCSPKVTDGRYHPLRPDLLARVDALKFIVTADAGEYHTVGEVGQAGTSIPVYVQPMDEVDPARNSKNIAHALALAQTHGYLLSLQTHKMLGIA
jgi:organic radical activating enzyme